MSFSTSCSRILMEFHRSSLYGVTDRTVLWFIYLLSGPSFQMRNEEKMHSLEESENVQKRCPDLGVRHQYSILLLKGVLYQRLYIVLCFRTDECLCQ